uniref:Uncharacterized protein n=1 Tax=Anguilla anguilla TaxID=7936 RepID=A0A0E9XAL0_ANGAN
MCCSMVVSPSQSPLVNSTIVCLQTLSLRSSRCSTADLLCSSLNAELTLMTRKRAQGPGGHRDTLRTISCLSSSAVSFTEYFPTSLVCRPQ